MEIKYCPEKANPADEPSWCSNYEHEAWKEYAKTVLHVINYAITRLLSHIKSVGRDKNY